MENKVAIIFYSFSGNTRKIARFLKTEISSKASKEVELIEIKPVREEKNFFKQSFQALKKKTPRLPGDLKYDLSEFQLVIFGSPVWAFSIAPPLRSYLKKAAGIEGRKTACFLNYGSGAGASKALRELNDVLNNKKANRIFSINLKAFRSKKKEYLRKEFKPLLDR